MISLKYYGFERWQPQSFPTEQDALQIALLVCISSFLLGIVSLFGIGRHGIKVILWKAMIGIVASCIFGGILFVSAIGDVAHQ